MRREELQSVLGIRVTRLQVHFDSTRNGNLGCGLDFNSALLSRRQGNSTDCEARPRACVEAFWSLAFGQFAVVWWLSMSDSLPQRVRKACCHTSGWPNHPARVVAFDSACDHAICPAGPSRKPPEDFLSVAPTIRKLLGAKWHQCVVLVCELKV